MHQTARTRLALVVVILAFLFAFGGQDARRAAAEETPGTIITIAGAGSSPSSPPPGVRGPEAPATGITVRDPQDVATDSDGNLYIAEWTCFVSKVRDGRITVAASSEGGCLNGFTTSNRPPADRSFNSPRAVATDAAGDLYVGSSCFVVKVANNVVSRITGNINNSNVCAGGDVGQGGPAVQGGLNDASGVALDRAGNIYIADAGGCRVHRVSAADGIITTVAGSGVCGYGGDGGAATAAQLNAPWGIEVDTTGNLYIADSRNCRVRKVEGTTISTVAGTGTCNFSVDSGDGGLATEALITRPVGVALDATGDLYISEIDACRVRKVADGRISTVAGTGTCGYGGDGGLATNALLNAPLGIAVDDAGNLYIADSRNGRVRMVVGAPPSAAAVVAKNRPNMTRSVPSPLEVSTDPDVVGTNITMALLTLLVILLASQLFNATLSENRDEIEKWRAPEWLAPLLKPIRAISRRLGANRASEEEGGSAKPFAVEGQVSAMPATEVDRGPALRITQAARVVSRSKWPLLILVMTVFIYGFAEPGFGLNTRSAVLALGLLITVGLVTLGVEGGKAYFARTRYERQAAVRPYPLAIGIAVANVIFCRGIGFGPGVIFGFVGILTLLERPPRPLTPEGAGKTAWWPLVGLLIVSFAAWFLVVPTRALARETGWSVAAFSESTSVSLFVVGIQGTIFSLIPLTFMDGDKILRWSKLRWSVAGLFALALGWHTLVNQDQAYLQILSSRISLTAFVILIVVSAASFGFWFYFARHSLSLRWSKLMVRWRELMNRVLRRRRAL